MMFASRGAGTPTVAIRLQFWGRETAASDRLVRAHSEQAFAGLGRVAMRRRGGQYCMAPVYDILVDDGKDQSLLMKRHEFFLDGLRRSRSEANLPPMHVAMQRPAETSADL